MDRFKEFVTNYLTGFLSVLIVFNLIIVLFGMMGVGLQQMLQVPKYFINVLKEPSHFLSHEATSDGTSRSVRRVSGVVGSTNIRLVCSDETFAASVSKVRPAVVNISCGGIDRAPGTPGNLRFDYPVQDLLNLGGIGSGIIVDSGGYILTCYHTVSRASDITITPFGSEVKSYRARLIAKDENLNLAVLKINVSDELPAATLGDSSQMEVADVVLAIGSPFGLEQSLTHGIVSDDRRDILIGGRIYREMMQTDVPINRGSSGGPLININGEVIGINMAIYSTTGVYNGVSFAMPVNQAKLLLAKTIQ